METKTDKVKKLIAEGKFEEAIKIVAKFPFTKSEKDFRDIILRARDCINNPSFYVQLGQDIQLNIELGKSALLAKYSER